LISKSRSTIFKLWYQAIEKIVLRDLLINRIPYDFFGKVLAMLIVKHQLVDTILPFPNEITFRFGSRNTDKYYSTDQKFIQQTIDKLRNGSYQIIILYGSSGLYRKPYSDDSMLSSMLDYAESLSPTKVATLNS